MIILKKNFFLLLFTYVRGITVQSNIQAGDKVDENLIMEKLVKGDTSYFEHLVISYEKRVYGFIYNMVNDRFAAEDLTQEVFIRVYRNIHKFDTEYPVKPWIFKIAYNRAASYFKGKKNNITDYDSSEVAAKDDTIGDFEIRQVLIKELADFSKENRAIFILRLMEDLSFQQISLILGTSADSIKMKFYRNRKILAERLKFLKEEV